MEGYGLCILLFVLGSSVQCMGDDGCDDKKRAALGFALRESPCQNGNWNFLYCQCDCFLGFTGHKCEHHYDPCHGVDCHHGHCYHDSNYTAHCRCDTGFYDSHCTERDPCHDLNCYHGTCHVSGVRGAYCTCTAGYFGVHCTDFDPCRSFYCGTGTCMMVSAHVGLPHCNCPYGYYGSHCENYDLCRSFYCDTGTCMMVSAHVALSHISLPHCDCPYGYYGSHCEIEPTTTTATTTTTTTTALPTTAQTHYTCKTAQSIADLASNVQSQNVNASNCTTGDNAGSDAFVLNHCDVEQPAAWKRGQNVMLICNSVPIYTPIATFAYTRYNPGFDTAAIFLGCLGDDIRIGLQTCDAGTRIEHFKKGGQGYRDATQYYVIQ